MNEKSSGGPSGEEGYWGGGLVFKRALCPVTSLPCSLMLYNEFSFSPSYLGSGGTKALKG